MRHIGDITKIKGHDVPLVDVVTGGSPCQDLSCAGKRAGLAGERSGLFMEQIRVIQEMREKSAELLKESGNYNPKNVKPRYMVWENVCFAEDTWITCESGYKKIKDVAVGEKVKTLSGRYMPVVKTYINKKKDVVELSFMGGEPLIVTPNHPIWAREKYYVKNKRHFSLPKWTPAGELTKNHMVAYVLDVPTLPDDFITKAEAWAIGRWLADGSVSLKCSTPRIFISSGLKKADMTREHLTELPYSIHENFAHPTAINFSFTSREFYMLIKDCGIGAANKKVAPFIFNLPIELQSEVLDGYISGDGHVRRRGNEIEFCSGSVSKELSYGIARLVRNVKHVGVSISVRPPKDGEIKGNPIKANYNYYIVYACFTNHSSPCIYEDGIVWQPVKEVIPKGIATVYNLSVLEDNTYAANDIMGHNCGALSSNSGEDFRCVLEETAKIADKNATIPRPEGGKWPYAGLIVSDGWSLAYAIHDAQYWGVPQRRKRVCLICDFNGQSAGDILFELRRETTDSKSNIPFSDTGTEPRSEVSTQSKGLSGNTQTCAGEGKETSRDIGAGVNQTSYTLKIRGGVEVDSHGKKAGKGPLVQTELSGTLGVSQDQTLITNASCLNPWDVQSKHIQSENGIAESLYSGECRYGGGESYVMQNKCYGIGSYDSNAMKSSNPYSGIYEADTSRTLDLNGGNPGCNQGGMAVVCLEGNGSRDSHKGDGYKESETMYTLNTVEQHAVCLENHPADSRVKISEDGIVQTLSSRMGTGGNNVPMVMEKKTYQDTTGSLMASGYNKLGTQEAANDMFVVQSMEVFHCTSEEDKASTLKARDWKDPQIVAYSENKSEERPEPITASKASYFMNTRSDGKADTLVATDYKDPQMVCYGLDRASFNQGQNAMYDFSVEEEKAQTLVSRGPGGVFAKKSESSTQENIKE